MQIDSSSFSRQISSVSTSASTVDDAIETLIEDPEASLKDNVIRLDLFCDPSVDALDTVQWKIHAVLGEDDSSFIFSNREKTQESVSNSEELSVLYTPVRLPESPKRIAETNKCEPGENKLWITDRLSGCAVFIIDWGVSETGQHQYSMLHMQPQDWAKLGEDAHELEKDIDTFVNIQNTLIDSDLSRVFDKMISPNGNQPQGYIAVYSEEDYMAHDLQTSVIGINNKEGEFRFFKQSVKLFCTSPCASEVLHWKKWVND